MIGNTDFDKAEMEENILHNMQRCVFLHGATNLTNLFY